MNVLTLFLAILIGLLIVVLIFLFSQSFFFKYVDKPNLNEDYPFVSIVIAMRNEQENITKCLQSIQNLDYPKEKYEVLIGDDQSTDNSCQIVEEFTQKHSNFNLFKIDSPLNNLQGKANVLAQVCKFAKGKYLAFTDADIEVSTSWLKGMVSQMDEETGIVSGITAIKNNAWQNIDWIYSIGMVKTVSDLNVPITALGNNMMISKRIYDEIGGFENLEFSITEDYQIFQKIVSKYGYKNLFHKEVLAISKPIKGFVNLLMQRKRWMSGAVQLPWQILGILILQALYYPLIIVLFFINDKAALFLFWTKYVFQTLYISILFIKLRMRVSFYSLLLYEFYNAIIAFSLVTFYVLPIIINWKGRKY